MADAIRTSLTVREYDQSKKVPVDTIRSILEAGRMTPSSRNRQPWCFVAVTDKSLVRSIGKLATSGRHISDSSFCIAVVTDPENRWNVVDGARAVQNMTLLGWSLGLGTSWVGTFDKDRMKELLNIPKNLDILTMLPFGYPTKKFVGKKDRKPLDQVAFLNAYGRSFDEN